MPEEEKGITFGCPCEVASRGTGMHVHRLSEDFPYNSPLFPFTPLHLCCKPSLLSCPAVEHQSSRIFGFWLAGLASVVLGSQVFSLGLRTALCFSGCQGLLTWTEPHNWYPNLQIALGGNSLVSKTTWSLLPAPPDLSVFPSGEHWLMQAATVIWKTNRTWETFWLKDLTKMIT